MGSVQESGLKCPICGKNRLLSDYYDRLSLSEKIRAGLEVSELVKRLTGRNYPVFIDNMESVDELTNVRPTGQIIMAKCVRGAELTVRPMGRPQVQKAA